MRVSILTPLPEGTSGGGFQFLKKLRIYLERKSEYSSSHYKSDIVLINSLQISSPLCFFRAFLLKLLGKKIIHRVAGPISAYRPRDIFLDKSIKHFNRGVADFSIFQSQASKNANNSIGINPSRYRVILNWKPSLSSKLDYFKNKKNSPLKIIMCSWSTNPMKGFPTLKFLSDSLDRSSFQFYFLGNRPCNYYDFKNVSFLPPVEHKDIASTFDDFDLFLFPSYYEACSNVLSDALSFSLPVLARNESSNPELMNNIGLLYDSDSQALKLLENIYDGSISVPYLSGHLHETTDIFDDYYNVFLQTICLPSRPINIFHFLASYYYLSLWYCNHFRLNFCTKFLGSV